MTKKKNKWDLEQEAHDAGLDAIWGRVEEKVGKDGHVLFSVYETDDKGVPIDNLDEIAFQGKVRFRQQIETFWCGKEGKDYESPVLENPTWLDLCFYANEMIITTNDHHHVFLEGITVIGREGDVTIAEFDMGS